MLKSGAIRKIGLGFESYFFGHLLADLICFPLQIYKLKLRVAMIGKSSKRLSPDDIKQRLKNFLINYSDPQMEPEMQQPYDRLGRNKYMIMMQKMANQRLNLMEINIEDIEETLRKEEERKVVEEIKSNVKRYIEIFYDIVQGIMPKRDMNINPEEDTVRYELQNALKTQREQNMRQVQQSLMADNQKIPSKMNRKYSIFITYKHRKPNVVKSISEITSSMIGSLVVVKGIVIKTDEVKPRLSIGTFTCDICGCENYMEIMNDKFTPMHTCQSKKCRENNVSGKLTFLPKHSRFMPSQEIKIQEVPEQLRQGNIPRNMKLILTETNIKKAYPGDIIEIQGVVLPKRKESPAFDQDIMFDSCMQAFKVLNQKKRYVDMNITEQDKQEIEKIRKTFNDQEIFDKLASSIAPEIYGLQCVKKALLLLMAGGVTAVTNDNMKIRGEINIMLVGDPGVAKSQLLKYISYMAPRGVYTTGKGSSDVGLTAAIKIDPTTKDVSLEAGALVLADMGVCCIDQFDKMNEYDRTAIHQVMQQQTVSIAKAGLTTTLNARTSVLAAANPLYSRYNPNQTPHKNINLPAALLSRFDLIFILLDTPDYEKDIKLAHHIGKVHQTRKISESFAGFSMKTLKNYIALAKQFEPKLSEKLSSILIAKYVKKRIFYSDKMKEGQRYITTRNLLALIRLCQARARLRFSNDISQQDIEVCEGIMQESQKGVDTQNQVRKEITDDMSRTYSIIKAMLEYREQETKLDYNLLKQRVLAKGLSEECLLTTLEHYEKLAVLTLDKNRDVTLL